MAKKTSQKKSLKSSLKSSLKNQQLLEICGQQMFTGMSKKQLISKIKEERQQLFKLKTKNN